jgi:uncharacterized protein (TIGR03437 family)
MGPSLWKRPSRMAKGEKMHRSGRADLGLSVLALSMLAFPPIGHAQGGIITTIAGSTKGTFGFSGDGGPATSALLSFSPGGVGVDSTGRVYIADQQNNRIRRIDTTGVITTVAGNGSGTFAGDGGPATSAGFSHPPRVVADSAGNFYFGINGGRIQKVDSKGVITTFVGTGGFVYSGDGGPATSAGISQVAAGVAVDGQGNFYFVDQAFYRVRKVNAAGIISTIAGNGTKGYSGDGGPATSAQFDVVVGVAADNAGNVYIADTNNGRIRKIDTSGIITTVAGNGTVGYSGNGGPATSAALSGPVAVAVDGAGNLYICDTGNSSIRKVDTSGIITTVAGTGKPGNTADGGLATATALGTLEDVAVDAAGNIYIVDYARIRMVTAGGASSGGGGGPPPVITAVVDAAAYTSNIAQGSVFVVKGTNLCPSGTLYGTVPYASSPLNGVQITFTPVGGGAATGAYMVYTYGAGSVNQLAAILPSTVPAGDYNVTVTNSGGVSTAFKATVVAHKFGIISVSGSGSGRAVVQNYISATQYDLNRYTTGTLGGYTYSPAHPGQVIVIWGTGLGPISSPDNTLPGAIDLRSALTIQVLINGVAYTPDLYGGRAPGLPGADEIIVTLPANVAVSCVDSLQISVNGQLSNPTTISIAAGTDSVCSAPGISTATLTKLDQGGNFTVGVISLAAGSSANNGPSIRVDVASAEFYSLNADGLNAAATSGSTTTPNNSCTATRQTIVTQINSNPTPIAFTLLNAGKILLNGPNVVNVPLSVETILNGQVAGVTVISGAVYTAGTYTITGQGGKDVGAFQTNITLVQPLVVTGTIGKNISRSADLPIAWTGGGTQTVTITAASAVAAPGSTPAQPITDSGVVTCVTTADKGGFTIPTAMLQQLPAANGSVTIVSDSTNSNFTAPLVSGGNVDFSYIGSGFQSRFAATYQ